jgi:hypothetical protein
MTALVNQLLVAQLTGTPGWNQVHQTSDAMVLNEQAPGSIPVPKKGDPSIDPTPSTQTT